MTARKPTGLGKAGAALWSSIAGEFELEPHESQVLLTACRQADVVADLEAVVKRDGPLLTSPSGIVKTHPALAEARQGRLALSRLLGALSLPESVDEGQEPERMTEAQRRGRKAAQARWKREKARAGG